jgi:hypothetical protein
MFKKIFLFALLIVAFTSCSDDRHGRNNIGKIVRTTIKDVAYVYEKTSSLRSASDYDSYGFIDKIGNEIIPKFVNEKGEDVASEIHILSICDLNSEFLIISIESDTGDKGWGTGLLINKKTEATYDAGNNLFSCLEWSYTDAQGNIYLSNTESVFKINPQNAENITVENYLPETEYGNGYFVVNQTSVCAYWRNDILKFKCPGGQIYPISQLLLEENITSVFDVGVFVGFNGSIYITKANRFGKIKLYKLLEPTNNKLAVEEVAEFDGGGMLFPIENPVKKTHFWASSQGKLVEFDEKINSITETEIDIPCRTMSTYSSGIFTYSNQLFVSSDAVYIGDKSSNSQKFTKLPYSDYSQKSIMDFAQLGYEAYSISTASTSSGLSFSGLNYSNGNYVIGEIDSKGAVNILDSRNNGGQIRTLIKLN